MRVDAVRVFAELNESTKAQQAFLNSCSDAVWMTDDERRAIRWLLSALVDHRRRLRVISRLWRTLAATEPVPCDLVTQTTELLEENRHFAPFIARWRTVVVDKTRIERNDFWHSMIELAEMNLAGTCGTGETCSESEATAAGAMDSSSPSPAGEITRPPS